MKTAVLKSRYYIYLNVVVVILTLQIALQARSQNEHHGVVIKMLENSTGPSDRAVAVACIHQFNIPSSEKVELLKYCLERKDPDLQEAALRLLASGKYECCRLADYVLASAQQTTNLLIQMAATRCLSQVQCDSRASSLIEGVLTNRELPLELPIEMLEGLLTEPVADQPIRLALGNLLNHTNFRIRQGAYRVLTILSINDKRGENWRGENAVKSVNHNGAVFVLMSESRERADLQFLENIEWESLPDYALSTYFGALGKIATFHPRAIARLLTIGSTSPKDVADAALSCLRSVGTNSDEWSPIAKTFLGSDRSNVRLKCLSFFRGKGECDEEVIDMLIQGLGNHTLTFSHFETGICLELLRESKGKAARAIPQVLSLLDAKHAKYSSYGKHEFIYTKGFALGTLVEIGGAEEAADVIVDAIANPDFNSQLLLANALRAVIAMPNRLSPELISNIGRIIRSDPGSWNPLSTRRYYSQFDDAENMTTVLAEALQVVAAHGSMFSDLNPVIQRMKKSIVLQDSDQLIRLCHRALEATK